MNFADELSKFEVGSKEYRFFKRVFEKLEDNCLEKSVAQDVKEAHSALNKSMQSYFESYILANAVMKSTEQSEILNETKAASQGITKVADSSANSLYLNLVKKNLPLDKASEDVMFFGLTQDAVENMLKNQQKSEAECTAFKKLVEENINEFCIKFIKCTGNDISSDENWREVFDKTIKDLESKVALLSIEETRKQSTKQLKDTMKIYYEELSKSIELLNKLILLHEEKLQFETDVAEYYKQRCHTVYLKVRVLGLKILEATYNEETIPALKKISMELNQREEKLKEEQNEKRVVLDSFLKLGKEYEHLVDEYASLTKNIRELQWSIDELKNNKLLYET